MTTMMQTKISSFFRPSFTLHESRKVHHRRISMALSSSSPFHHLLCKSTFPLAASLTLLISPCTAQAGLMSGSPGIESVPGPELPKLEFLERFNEKNQKFYAEKTIPDSNNLHFSRSYLKTPNSTKKRMKEQFKTKYCLRGAEWGVGDCSTTGMTDEEKDKFITMLKEKTGLK